MLLKQNVPTIALHCVSQLLLVPLVSSVPLEVYPEALSRGEAYSV